MTDAHPNHEPATKQCPHGFREYINRRRRTDTPAGDFVEDAQRDRAFPDVKSWAELESYLWGRGAIPEAVAAARTVWRQYRRKEGATEALRRHAA